MYPARAVPAPPFVTSASIPSWMDDVLRTCGCCRSRRTRRSMTTTFFPSIQVANATRRPSALSAGPQIQGWGP